jgi:hypothetical protein
MAAPRNPGADARGQADDLEDLDDDVEVDGDDDLLDDIDDSEGRIRARIEGLIPDLVKRTFEAGVGAVLSTEEGIRRFTKDMSLPKDVAGYLANTAQTTKDEVLRLMSREIREFLQTVNLSEEIAKMLTTLSFEVKTEIRFIPNDQKLGGVTPDVNASVALKRTNPKERRRRRSRRRT